MLYEKRGFMMKDLYIIGAGGFGREVAWLVERINEVKPTWNIKGFIDDDETLWGIKEDNYKVVGGCSCLREIEGAYVVCAVASTRARKRIIEKLEDSKIKFASIIDPSVIISNRVKIGEGAIICAGTILTVDIKIGNHVIINPDCTIGHDVAIEDYVTIYPSVNVSGNVSIGECSEFGTGTQIIQGKRIAEDTITGAGTIVVKTIDEAGTYVGSPAKKIR